jgi:hypothetical protein
MHWAEHLATIDDPTQGGNMSVCARARGLVVQGCCLAAKGQVAEAEEALSAAAEKLSAIGWWLAPGPFPSGDIYTAIRGHRHNDARPVGTKGAYPLACQLTLVRQAAHPARRRRMRRALASGHHGREQAGQQQPPRTAAAARARPL